MTAPPNTIPWPPIIYGVAAAVGWALNRVIGLPLPVTPLLYNAGIILILLALAIDIWAALTFRRHRTTILPHRAARALITDGPFAWSRNPIYVGNTMLVSGLGLILGIGWMVLAAFLAALAVQKLAIEREERHLAHSFGAPWHDYARSVRRWI
jgi:protein-S-isoprenylcysteine O-methyltransferase Ste14